MASQSETGQEFRDLSSYQRQINEWIKDGIDLVTLINQGHIANVEGVKHYLECSGDSTCLQRTNSAGQTPLMISCKYRHKDIVEYLLKSGVDSNLTCTEYGNTALHYACQGNEDVKELCRKGSNYPTDKLQVIIKIVEILVSYGATWQMNKDGLSPACVAALNSFTDVVDFLTSSNVLSVPIADKVKAYELLGVSQAVFDEQHVFDACKSFHMSASFYTHNEMDKLDDFSTHISPDLDDWFVALMGKDALNANDKMKIMAKAFHIGLQCVPCNIRDKENYFHALTKCGKTAFFDGVEIEEGYSMLVDLIKEEMRAADNDFDESGSFGTVLRMIKDAVDPAQRAKPCSSSAMMFLPKLLAAYAVQFRTDTGANILDIESRDIIEALGDILFNIAYYHGSSKYIELCFQPVVSIMDSIKAINVEDTDAISDPYKTSIVAVFMEKLSWAMWDDMYSGQSKETRKRVSTTIFRLLRDIGYDPDTDYFLLDTFVQVARVVSDMEWILSVSQVLIRYGCTVSDETISEHLDEDDVPEATQLLALLAPPTSPISLEELAARVVLRWEVPYQERLPEILCEKINGGAMFDSSQLDSPESSDEE